MTTHSEVSRRDFLRAGVAAGAGLTLAVYLSGCEKPADKGGETAGTNGGTDGQFSPNAWVRIAASGQVTLVVDRSEMGQGVLTSMAMLLAEELDVDLSAIKVEQAPAGKEYGNASMGGIQGTGGSSSVRAAWKPLREAGAKARAMLVAAAASTWGVDTASCTTESGAVKSKDGQKRATYGELAAAAAKLAVPTQVTLKDPKDFRLIGKPVPRIDLADKVVGKAGFGIDAKVPGLLVARVARCPVFGGKATSFDADAAKKVPGVKHVAAIGSGVAVIADGYWQAGQGVKALNVKWDFGANANLNSESIRVSMKSAATGSGPGILARKEGAGNAAQQGKHVTAEYEAPYLAHACMEPMNATAWVQAGKCTVWVPTQYQWGGGGGAKETVAKTAGVPEAAVTINTTLLGGGFGRRFMHDFLIEAVECSKAANAPVKVVWSREDDIQHDFYRPAAYVKSTATIGANGMPVSWVTRVSAPSINVATAGAAKDKLDENTIDALANHAYDVPNMYFDTENADIAVPLGYWRSVGASQNGFFTECFIDEMAEAAGKDPLEFRRMLLQKKPRHRTVLEVAADKAGWGKPLPAGRARGIAMVESFTSHVAEVAEVSINPDGTPRVHRVVAAVDCGMIVNPDTVRAQVESAIVFGLTAALYGEITIKEGRVVQNNFNDYPMLRMKDMPIIEVHIVPSTEEPTGIGEPGTPPLAPAVANATYALTKKRIRRLPFHRGSATA